MREATASSLADAGRAQGRVAPMMGAALAALLVGMWAGLARIGWSLPNADGALMLRHGALMVVGFVSTVITVERAVAIRSIPAFAAPVFSAVCALTLVLGAPAVLPPLLVIASGSAYAYTMADVLRRHRALPSGVMLAGAMCLAGSGIVWSVGGSIAHVLPWWIAFLTLTIGAERLELLRFQRLTAVGAAHGALAIALIGLGPVVTLLDRPSGARLLGLGLVVGSPGTELEFAL